MYCAHSQNGERHILCFDFNTSKAMSCATNDVRCCTFNTTDHELTFSVRRVDILTVEIEPLALVEPRREGAGWDIPSSVDYKQEDQL